MKSELEIDSDIAFQQREWQVRRIGWWLWAVVLAAGCLGLLGPGLLSRSSVADSSSRVVLHYDRFLQYHQPSELTFEIRPNQPETSLLLSQSFVNAVRIHRIEPEPIRTISHPDGSEFIVATSAGDRPEQAVVTITVHYEFDQFGLCSAVTMVNDSNGLALNQYVYP